MRRTFADAVRRQPVLPPASSHSDRQLRDRFFRSYPPFICQSCLRRRACHQPRFMASGRPVALSSTADLGAHDESGSLRSLGRSRTPARTAGECQERLGSVVASRVVVGTTKSGFADQWSRSGDVDELLNLLLLQQRIRSGTGTRDILQAMLRQDRIWSLSGASETVRRIWEILMDLDLDSDRWNLYRLACRSFEDTASDWRTFHEMLLTNLLPARPITAYRWHLRLSKHGELHSTNVANLARAALPHPQSVTVFERVYLRSAVRDLYGVIIPLLCSLGKFDTALVWHHLLLRNDDLPASPAVFEPLLDSTLVSGQPGEHQDLLLSSPVEEGKGVISRPDLDPKSGHSAWALRTSESIGVATTASSSSRTDHFVARLWATTMFPTEFVIGTLHFLRIKSIGPVAMRELAVRDPDPQALLNALSQLQEAGISILPSKFSRLLAHLAREGDRDSMASLLGSNLHPETFEDDRLQESLLAWYLKSGNGPAVRRTSTVLSALSLHPLVERANVVLRAQLSINDLPAAKLTVAQMHGSRLPLTSVTRQSFLERLLVKSEHQELQPANAVHADFVDFLIHIFTGGMEDPASLPATAWKEILRRLREGGRLAEMERVSLWLATASTAAADLLPVPPKRSSMAKDHLRARLGLDRPDMPRIDLPSGEKRLFADALSDLLPVVFCPQTQTEILASGISMPEQALDHDASPLRKLKETAHLPFRPWTRGLLLLKALKERGVDVEAATIRKALEQHVIMLCGKEQAAPRADRRSRPHDDITRERVIDDARLIWGAEIFDDTSTPDAQRRESRKGEHQQSKQKLDATHFGAKRFKSREWKATRSGSATASR